tara:strand:- start:26 stop:850 length:825 start_codon:yes stop_codon:yes gene_type:complete
MERTITSDSYPYVTGMGFRNRSHMIFDEFQQDSPDIITDDGQIIFIKTDMVPYFFNFVMPQIRNNVIILTHNSALGINERYIGFLNNNKVICWYAQNANFDHPRLFSIPLGIANLRWTHGDIAKIDKVNEMQLQKKNLVYMNFDLQTNISERTKVYDMFVDKDYVLKGSKKSFEEYLNDLARCKFTLSPPGAGIDCHRIWESIAVGTIPIVENCHNISFHTKMPILVIDDWRCLSQEFLEHKYYFLCSELYNKSPLYLDYWIQKIGLKNVTRQI